MTDKDNSQTGEYSYTYSYSYSKEGGEKNVEVHTGGSSAAAAGEAAVDSTGKTTAGESSSGKSATGKTTTIKSTTGKTTTRSRSTTTSSRSSTSSRSKNDNSGPDVGYWIMTAIFFVTGLWPVGLIMLISKLSDPKRRKTAAKTASTTTRKTSAAIQKATQTPQYSAKSAKWMKIAGILLTIVGAVAFFNGVADNLFWLEDGFRLHYVKHFLEGLFYPTGLLAGGIGLLIGSGSMTRRHRRYASYLRIAGKRSSISVASLARAAEVSERRAERDLQAMLEKGLWGEEAYLDLGRGMLFRSHEAAEDQERQERQREAPQVPQEAEEGYSGMLRSIRRSNDRIADPELSRKMDRLEEIAGKILKPRQEESGSHLPELLPAHHGEAAGLLCRLRGGGGQRREPYPGKGEDPPHHGQHHGGLRAPAGCPVPRRRHGCGQRYPGDGDHAAPGRRQRGGGLRAGRYGGGHAGGGSVKAGDMFCLRRPAAPVPRQERLFTRDRHPCRSLVLCGDGFPSKKSVEDPVCAFGGP